MKSSLPALNSKTSVDNNAAAFLTAGLDLGVAQLSIGERAKMIPGNV